MEIQARWRKRTYIAAFNNEPKKMFESFYTVKGELQSVRLWQGSEKPVFGQPATIINNARTTACSSPFAVTTNAVNCTGGMENTTCYFYKITTYYIFCVEGDGHPTVEPESVAPEDNGWYEFYSLTEEFENKDIIDSLQGYPCAQEILKLLPDLTGDVKKMIYDVFGKSETFNLIFKVNKAWGKNDLVDGDAITRKLDNGTWEAEIRLNPWVLSNSTQEYIHATMIHEGIHAYIQHQWGRYNRSEIDSNTFKAEFPIYWQTDRVLNDREIIEHNEMAENYLGVMITSIKRLSPIANYDALRAIAWGGLHKTTTWAREPNKYLIGVIQAEARDVSLNQYHHYNFKKCP